METHSSILAWRIPMDRGAWQAYSPWGCKELDTTKQLSTRDRKSNRKKKKLSNPVMQKNSLTCNNYNFTIFKNLNIFWLELLF